MNFEFIFSWRIHLLIISIQFVHILCLPGLRPAVKSVFRRGDLFLDDSYFLGLPNLQGVLEQLGASGLGEAGPYSDTSGQGDVVIHEDIPSTNKPQPHMSGKSANSRTVKKDEVIFGWPGRRTKVPITNAASDVVSAYTKNLEIYKQKTEALIKKPVQAELVGALTACTQSCNIFHYSEITARAICFITCGLERSELADNLAVILFLGVKGFCHVTNTLYTRLDELGVHDLELFQKVMGIAQSLIRMPMSMNVPLRSVLVRLTNELFSTFAPFRAFSAAFNETLAGVEYPLNLGGKVLVGAHPGCAMLNLDEQIIIMFGELSKDLSLVDYLIFQGYALFTSVTKYMEEFPTKKSFAAINQGLDKVLGTSCGLYLYAEGGAESDCDQFGGFPMLNMPVPEFIWNDESQLICERTKARLLLKGVGGGNQQSPSGASVDQVSPAPSAPPRKRRSLIVGRRNHEKFMR